MQLVQELYRHVAKEVYGKQVFTIRGHEVDFGKKWEVLEYRALFKTHYNIDPIAASEDEVIAAAKKAGVPLEENTNKARATDALWKKIRKSIAGPAFLTGIPVYLEPLAKRAQDGQTVERLQVLIAGSEVGKGYSELNDPQDQRRRFEDQQALRDAGDDEAQRLDVEYVEAMEYGMPPAFGFGVSERLFAFLEDKNAHEAQLFPLLRPKQ
jgi:lysyl-tRNA synthetase, class II